MGSDPNCEPYAHGEQCERPFADDIGFGSGRVLIKRCHVRLRGVTRYARREVLADLIALRPPSGLPRPMLSVAATLQGCCARMFHDREAALSTHFDQAITLR